MLTSLKIDIPTTNEMMLLSFCLMEERLCPELNLKRIGERSRERWRSNQPPSIAPYSAHIDTLG